MTTPKNTRKVSSKRLYEWRRLGAPVDEKPEQYWSVTTLIKGGIPSPALTYWAAKATAEFAVANHRQVSAMLDAVRLTKDDMGFLRVTDPDAVQSAIDWLKGSPWRERDRKADLGSAVHAAAEAYVLGASPPKVPDEAFPYIESFHAFLDDWKPKYELAEASVYNRTFKYAGTLDAIAVVDGLNVTPTRLILDYKTTGSGVYPEAALQLSAYRNAEFVGMRDGSEQPMPAVDGAAVVWLKPGGYEFIPVITDDDVFRSFRHCVEVFRWAEEISKGVIGNALPA
ncbi:MAG: hypothetical protein ACREJC_09680, partial [Tepidisphaeraceae bacterium]